ncbi:MAG: hypothetical protein ACYC9J_09680 [Sulfuricaulis sp.]
MARLAMDEANPPELRGRMFAELAQYVAPKRRAMEISEPRARDELSALPMSELLRRLDAIISNTEPVPALLPDPAQDDSSTELH